MRPGSVKWTAWEEDKVRHLVAVGATARDAGEALGREPETVRRKAIAMGLTFARSTAARQSVVPKVDATPPIPEIPRYSSRMAMMLGDPPIGRSALDQKRMQS